MSIHGNWNFLHSFQNGSTIPIAYDSDVPESWKDTEEEYTHYLRAFARRSAWKAASSGRQDELYIRGPVSKDTNAARVYGNHFRDIDFTDCVQGLFMSIIRVQSLHSREIGPSIYQNESRLFNDTRRVGYLIKPLNTVQQLVLLRCCL